MSFDAFARPPITELIGAAGATGKLSLLVGAGASMEAGLPSWETLVDRLLLRAGETSGLIAAIDPDAQPTSEQHAQRQRWLAEAARDGPLGKAALAEALAGSKLDEWIEDALFEPASGPQDYYPGPISRQIPLLHEAMGDDLRVMTLNYDDLIEQAFRDHPKSPDPYAISDDDHHVPAGKCGVFHLHGYLGRDERPQGRLILSEADYMRMQRGASWQEALVKSALMDSTLVFLGTSLLDPNVIRYLHGVRPPTSGQPARFSIFVRQGTYPEDVPADFRDAREKGLAKRWKPLESLLYSSITTPTSRKCSRRSRVVARSGPASTSRCRRAQRNGSRPSRRTSSAGTTMLDSSTANASSINCWQARCSAPSPQHND